MARSPTIEAAGETDVGRQRDHNEDSFSIDLDLGLFLVADGIGGAASGEIASRMAIDIVQSCCNDGDVEITQPMGFEPPPESLGRHLISYLWRANERIFDTAQRDPRHRGMGTTFAGLHTVRGTAYIAHVGDSRVYRFRDRRLEQLTEDHSLWNEYARRGEALPEEVDPLLARSVVTRALGMERTVEVETRIERLRDGDVFLLCSDGLSGPVPDAEIAEVLAATPDLHDAARLLVDRANFHGGPDNVTCIVVRWNAGG